ncbi:MAG: peptidoglycan-binding protein [Deltaproteobacteria bacterium]|nr:peptidoglycan-binding protein [Deltaproteobacteria bacterium]
MKHIILLTAMTVLAGLLSVGTSLGAEISQSAAMAKEGAAGSAVSQSLNQDQIRELQNLLNDRGYDAGMADGIMGSRTRDAILRFQMAENLTATGTPDRDTLRALAPSVEKQQFFGLAPEFDEKAHQQIEQKPMEQPVQSPPGSKVLNP